MLIGLELPVIVKGLEGVNLSQAIGYGVLITAVLMVGRILSALGASVFTTFISRYITTADSRPGFRMPFIFGWAGMRGVVSLAAALSIPAISNGQPFPQRNLILFITFMVILLTLVIQGLSLPWLIRVMKLTDRTRKMPEEEENKDIHRRLARESLAYLKQNFSEELHSHPALGQLATQWENKEKLLEDPTMHHGYKKIYLQLLDQQRKWLREWNKDFSSDEELIRKHLMRLDLEEERIKYA
jgi:CPA1 family monovalent cation:H+ antiporter